MGETQISAQHCCHCHSNLGAQPRASPKPSCLNILLLFSRHRHRDTTTGEETDHQPLPFA